MSTGVAWDRQIAALSPRERQVLQLVLERCRNSDIALELGISVATVEYHVSRVLVKLEARSRWDLLAAARRQRLESSGAPLPI